MEEPKIIGSGSYGCVYKPGFECDNPNINIGHRIDVMKVQDASAPVDEYEQGIIDTLKILDPDQKYYTYISESCKLNKQKFVKGNCKHQFENPMGYFMKDAGKTLKELADTQPPELFINSMIFWLADIIFAIGKLLSKKIVHGDIKWDNIAIDPQTKKARLIDFGLSSKIQDIGKKIYSEAFVLNPPFLNIHNKSNLADARNELIPFDYKFINYKKKINKFYRNLLGKEYLPVLYEKYNRLKENYMEDISLEQLAKIDLFGLGFTFIFLLEKIDYFPHKIDGKIKSLLLRMTHIDPNKQCSVIEAYDEIRTLIEEKTQQFQLAQAQAQVPDQSPVLFRRVRAPAPVPVPAPAPAPVQDQVQDQVQGPVQDPIPPNPLIGNSPAKQIPIKQTPPRAIASAQFGGFVYKLKYL